MSTTLQEIVREQILAEGPDTFDGVDMNHGPTQERYIDEQLNAMSNVELLERISNALGALRRMTIAGPIRTAARDSRSTNPGE